MSANLHQQNRNCQNRITKPQPDPILLGTTLALAISLLSACTLRSDSSYSTKVSETEAAPAAEALTGERLEQSNETATSPAELVERLRTNLATELGVSPTEISLREAIPTQWNDACLGISSPTEVCAQVITPGYRIVLSTPTKTYTFHTDQTGKQFRRLD